MNAPSLDVQRAGFLRRLKTLKRRYFVLRSISVRGKPRLEYYENEKKFRTNSPPKRVIYLASCFNITQKEDTRHEFVFALYTREDVFGLICESKDELHSWLCALLKEQSTNSSSHGNDYLTDNLPVDIQLPAMRREYVASLPHVSSWPVTVKARGLGTSRKLAGAYNLKLADHTLGLHKISSDEVVADFHLTMIRRCGHTDRFFFMEVGRSSATGAGELWMQVDDAVLAKNLHEVVLMSIKSLSDGHSSVSRHRCHSGGHKPRPTSLMLLPPPRTRSDTFPDPEAASPDQEESPSFPKAETPDKSSPSGGKRTAMFQRLWTAGKRKSEVFDFSPRLFSRRTQSKSLSIDPCPGGLLGRTQSVDFATLFGALPSSPETPEERDVCFDIEQPQRTSSNSSGSSERSWEQSLSRSLPCTREETDSKSLAPSSRPNEVFLADEGYDSTARDDNTPEEAPSRDDNRVNNNDDRTTIDENISERELNYNKDNEQQNNSLCCFDDQNNRGIENQASISQRNHSGYEDMSGNLLSSGIIEKPENDYVNVIKENSTNSFEHEKFPLMNSPSMQRRTSEPSRNDSPIMEHMELKTKSSPKQRRTSEPMAVLGNDFLEMVTIKNSPSSSPRRNRKGKSGKEVITEYPGSLPDENSLSQSLARRRLGRDNEEYVDMNPRAKYHTYVNINPKEGFQLEEERAYMNFHPGDCQDTQIEHEERDYMNFKPGKLAEEAEETTSYVNFQPGKTRQDKTSPRQKPKHTYENLLLNGTPKGNVDSGQCSDYMNFFPRRHSEKSPKGKTLPRRKPGLPWRRTGRRESEPVGITGRSDEENGMLFLDFSGNNSTPSKDLNYISLDLGQKEPSPRGSPKNRPSDITTSLTSWPFDVGPKSAPVSTTSYAEIDFTRSLGLRQAIIDHKKPKAPKE